MKISYYGIIAILVVVTAVALAGCTVNKTTGTPSASSGSTGSASSSSSAPAAATCPTAIAGGKGAWDGTWTAIDNINSCADERGKFNPPDATVADYFTPSHAGEFWLNPTFTQNGCDVTGTASIDMDSASTRPCHITLTGTASGTELKGTWKAYCNIKFSGVPESSVDNGIFDISMEPGSQSTFSGLFVADNDWGRKALAANCPNAHSGWVGKRS